MQRKGTQFLSWDSWRQGECGRRADLGLDPALWWLSTQCIFFLSSFLFLPLGPLKAENPVEDSGKVLGEGGATRERVHGSQGLGWKRAPGVFTTPGWDMSNRWTYVWLSCWDLGIVIWLTFPKKPWTSCLRKHANRDQMFSCQGCCKRFLGQGTRWPAKMIVNVYWAIIDQACMCILSFKVYGILYHAHFIHEESKAQRS